MRYQHLVATCILAILVWWSQQHERGFLVLAIAMLSLPMLDTAWRVTWFRLPAVDLLLVSTSLLAAWIIVSSDGSKLSFLVILAFIAIPEEVFFRSYLMPRLGKGLVANIAASMIFAGLHLLATYEWISLLVFLPSLLLGFLYQRVAGIAGVSLLHALFNVTWFVHLQALVTAIF